MKSAVLIWVADFIIFFCRVYTKKLRVGKLGIDKIFCTFAPRLGKRELLKGSRAAPQRF